MKRSSVIFWSFLVVILALVLRKIKIGYDAMQYVRGCAHEVSFEGIMKDPIFIELIKNFEFESPTMIIFLNQYALDMTFNWLCNIKDMPNAHKNLLVITLDNVSDKQISTTWPNLKRYNMAIPCLKDRFQSGGGRYQLFYLLRANIAKAIVKLGKPFWMVQQDTFWLDNLLDLPLNNTESDIIFDRVGEIPLIAGGYYYVRPTQKSLKFFEKLSEDLEVSYKQDSTYMTSLCSRDDLAKCGFVPYSILSNWAWLDNPSVKSPMIIQLDCETQLEKKLDKMKSLGFYFLEEDEKSCNVSAVKEAKSHVLNRTMLPAVSEKSYSHTQLIIYTWIIQKLHQHYITEFILNKIVYPYAYYFMFTI
uniref:Nucleotide-diphospho-sugar transferase domain-containing protein n=1 Tax=Acrobeloides nanus TaxID=290746 RepID=A0A914CCZ1_9BILA